mmetsp:Transcript_31974/g.62917  ORF Transcript_31974/g.62917 Transcript_31974/m.62917 type:complete len:89 (-) Transcript_31974:443-709(-)
MDANAESSKILIKLIFTQQGVCSHPAGGDVNAGAKALRRSSPMHLPVFFFYFLSLPSCTFQWMPLPAEAILLLFPFRDQHRSVSIISI